MKPSKKLPVTISILTLMSLTLMACNGTGATDFVTQQTAATATQPSTGSNESPPSDAGSEAAKRSYTDYKGHTVEIPASPNRIIFSGETFSDLLALDVKAVGTDTNRMKGSVFEDQIQHVEDIGFPTSLEKVLALNPDLIIVANPDETAYEQLSKIAPTLMFDTFAVGYTDEYYFSRRFRQITGMSPKQYADHMDVSKRVKDWTGHEVDTPWYPDGFCITARLSAICLRSGCSRWANPPLKPITQRPIGSMFLKSAIRRIPLKPWNGNRI
ncbi:AraC family transcriptional regulator [Paenibacillus sp. AK002]